VRCPGCGQSVDSWPDPRCRDLGNGITSFSSFSPKSLPHNRPSISPDSRLQITLFGSELSRVDGRGKMESIALPCLACPFFAACRATQESVMCTQFGPQTSILFGRSRAGEQHLFSSPAQRRASSTGPGSQCLNRKLITKTRSGIPSEVAAAVVPPRRRSSSDLCSFFCWPARPAWPLRLSHGSDPARPLLMMDGRCGNCVVPHSHALVWFGCGLSGSAAAGKFVAFPG
jgi:hypothetical protein